MRPRENAFAVRPAGVAGRPRRARLDRRERAEGLPVLRVLTVAPVVSLSRIRLLRTVAGIACRPALLRYWAVSVLLRRWRIPRVIRHVARSLFLVQSDQTQTVSGELPCLRGLRFD